MASWISSILLSLSLPASYAKGSGGGVYSWLQPLVNILSIFCVIVVLNRTTLDFFRDVCLLDTSNGLFCSLFNNRKYSSCTYRDCYDMYVNSMSIIIRNDIYLMLCYWSFVLRFLWVYFGIFCYLVLIYISQMMYVSINNLWSLFSDFTMIYFSWHSRLWSCRKFHCGNSYSPMDMIRFILTSFLAILSRFCRTHCVQRVSLSSAFLLLCRRFSTST